MIFVRQNPGRLLAIDEVERASDGVVLYTGDTALPFGDRLAALPIQALWT